MNKGRSRYYLVDVCAPRRTGHQICAAEKNCRHDCISIFYFSIYFSISPSASLFLYLLGISLFPPLRRFRGRFGTGGNRILQRVSLLVSYLFLASSYKYLYLFWHDGHGSNALVCIHIASPILSSDRPRASHSPRP